MADLTVADHVLQRLREWNVDVVFAYPGDGINGLLAAWGRADERPRFIQATARGDGGVRCRRLREVHRIGRGVRGDIGTRRDPPAQRAVRREGRPRAGGRDRRADRPLRDWAGPTSRRSTWTDCSRTSPRPTSRRSLVPEQLPNVLDRAFRVAITAQAPTAVIIPSDVQELPYSAPTHDFKMVPSSTGMAAGDTDARPGRAGPGRRDPQRRLPGRDPGRAGCQGRQGRAGRGRRPAGRRGGEGAAGQGRAARRPALRDRLDRPARAPGPATR